MIRVFLTVILPLLLPTALYLLWVLGMRRTESAGAGEVLRDLPWIWLVAAGCVLLAAVLLMAALRLGRSTDTAGYVPPHSVGGQIVPGHIGPAPAPRP